MKWQRAGRLTAATIGLCTAAALYITTRERAVVERPAIPDDVDPVATLQSGAGVEINTVHGVERWRLTYDARRVYDDGRVVFDAVHILFKEDGTELHADQAEVRGGSPGQSQPTSLTADGHVRFKTGEGATVEGESLTYEEDTEISRMPGPVTFTRGRTEGTGTGAVYERRGGVFRILEDAHVTLAADGDAGTRVVATAASLVFNSANRAMLFEGDARIARDVDLMTADAATLYLSEDEQQFQVIELRGNARVVPGAAPPVADPAAPEGAAAGPGGTPPTSAGAPPEGGAATTPDMRARDIDLAFYPGTQALERAVLSQQARLVQTGASGRRSIEGNVINFSTAPDGATLTHLEAHDRVVVLMPPSASVPEREIRAALLVAKGTEGEGLTEAVFSGGVEFTEISPASRDREASERSGTSRTLVLDLAGQLDAIDEARFQDDVTFKDGSVSGVADVGAYSVSAGVLRLEPHPQRAAVLPRVTDGAMRVDAARFIEVNLATHDLQAEGDVKTQSRREEHASPSRAALFDGPEPVLGFGDKFWYVRSKQQVRYTGTDATTARLRQGESEVRGDELILDDRTRDLRATGRVESSLPIEADGGEAAAKVPRVYRATADTMVYLDEARTVEYTGTPVTLETPDGRTTAARILLTLAEDGRQLQRMVATGDPAVPEIADVRSTLPEGREALSDSLTYDAAADHYTLRGRPGRPMVLQTREDDGTCSLLRGAEGHFRPGSSNMSEAANPGGTRTMGNQKCSSPLTR